MNTSIPQNLVQYTFNFDVVSDQSSNDNVFQDILRKQCHGPCQQFFPATSEFFSKDKTRKNGLQVLCKKCMSEYKKQHYQKNKEEIRAKHKDYAEANREAILEQKRQYYKENKEEMNKKNRAYHWENRGRLLERMKQYYRANKGKAQLYHKMYYEKNRQRIREYSKHYHDVHRDRLMAYLREYRKTNLDALQLKEREYGRNNKEKRHEYLKMYFQTEHGKMVSREHSHKRRARKLSAGGRHTAQELKDQKDRQKGKCYYCKTKLGEKWHADHVFPLSKGGSDDISNIVIACPTCNLRKKDRLLHNWMEGGRLL